MSAVPDSLFTCCLLPSPTTPQYSDAANDSPEPVSIVPDSGLNFQLDTNSMLSVVADSRNFTLNLDNSDVIQDFSFLDSTTLGSSTVDYPSPFTSTVPISSTVDYSSAHISTAPLLTTTRDPSTSTPTVHRLSTIEDSLTSTVPRLSTDKNSTTYTIPTAAPFVQIDDVNTGELQNEAMELPLCYSQLDINNIKNNCYHDNDCDCNSIYTSNTALGNPAMRSTINTTNDTTIFNLPDSNKFNTSICDTSGFNSNNIATRHEIIFAKPNSFESPCFPQDFYCDNDLSLKLNSTDLHRERSRFSYCQSAEHSIVGSDISTSTNCNESEINSTELVAPYWWETNPDSWNVGEIIEWVSYTLKLNKINSIIYFNNFFADINDGNDMTLMTLEDLIKRDPDNGLILFHSLNYFSQNVNVSRSEYEIFVNKENYPSERFNNFPSNIEMSNCKSDSIYSLEPYRFAPCQTNQQEHKTPSLHSSELEPWCGGVALHWDGSNENSTRCQQLDNINRDIALSSSNDHKLFLSCPPKRKPGRPRLHPLNKDSTGVKKMKILPLWEFIYSILQNNNFNPFIIRWEDEANGKFRFVHSEKFAKLWGEAKNNENMNYEKLSRAMRHYYGKDIIERVEGRRLVYRFLNPAMDRLRKKTNPEIPLSEMQRS
ncbi:transcription factor ETV6-like [Argonauta hians]